jgi:hypothetical protein
MTRTMRALLASTALALAAENQAADSVDATWDRLRSLVGEWEGQYSEGFTARVSYRLVSNGTALLETLESAHDDQMVTLYHRDGSTLLMTHYCSMGNQTRMRSRGLEGVRLVFAYVDTSNVKDKDELVMSGLALSFPGPDLLVHEWTSREGSREQTGRFEFSRKK